MRWSIAYRGVTDEEDLTRSTSAPRMSAASAKAPPILPLARFVNTRTSSMGSVVPPAVTRIRLFLRRVVRLRNRSISDSMALMAGSLPCPVSPQASGPESGATTWEPWARSAATFSCVAGWLHMLVFMDGKMRTGHVAARTVVVK